MKHTINIKNLYGDTATVLASSASAKGVKRLNVIVSLSASDTIVIFSVTSYKDGFTSFEYSGLSLEEAVDAYNAIE